MVAVSNWKYNKSGDFQYSLRLHKENPFKNWLLELHIPEEYETDFSVEFVQHYKEMLFTALPKTASWFLQGQSKNWILVEFWTDDQNKILNAVTEFLSWFNLELEIGEVK